MSEVVLISIGVFFASRPAYLATDPQKRNRAAYIDPDLAFALSKVYNSQQQYLGLTRGITQAMYLVPLKESFDAFVAATDTYFSNVVLREPQLLKMDDEILPLIDRELEQ